MKYSTAGSIAATAIWAYGIPVISDIRNAAAPIMGGIICPPVEAAASTAAANSLLYPMLFITGIVTLPLPTVLATELPEYIPSSADDITATFAGPPDAYPAMEFARSTKNEPIPVFSRNAPRIIKNTINVEHTLRGVPGIPFVV